MKVMYHVALMVAAVALLAISVPVDASKMEASPFFRIFGNPFALTIFMILVIIRMKVHSEKHLELSQTMALLSNSIRMEKGCRRCDFCQNVEKENELCLLEEWDTQENLKGHLTSKRFGVLRGAMNLLKEPYEMMFHTVFRPEGLEGL